MTATQTSQQHPWPMAPLELHVNTDTIADLCIALQLTRQEVFSLRRTGLTTERAAALAAAADIDPAVIWDGWQPPAAGAVCWEEPPPKRRQGAPFLTPEVEAALRANPGRWARIKDYPTKTSADSARKRVVAGVYGPGWEAEQRRTPTGSILYMRYVGK